MNMRVPEQLVPLVEETLLDFELFCLRFIRIIDAEGRLIPFRLNRAQRRLAKALQQHNRILVPKARQLGMSTLLRAWDVYQAYIAGRPVVRGCLSHHDRSAKHLHRIARGMVLSMPELVRPDLTQDSATTIEFPWGAQVTSFTAGSSTTTRSFTFGSAHLSEFAFWSDPREGLAVVLATVHDGQVVIETTANAPGDYFHQLCTGAPDNGWHLEFFPWWEHPDYATPAPEDFEITADETALQERHGLTLDQLAWRRGQIASIGQAKFRREYPATLDDCFLPGEGSYFSSGALDEIEPMEFHGAERVYEQPHPDDVYVVGCDPSGGTGGDYAAITVVSATTLQPVYQWRSNTMSPNLTAEHLLRVASKYNKAMVLVEANNHGHVVNLRLDQLGYTNQWRDPRGKPWTTTVQSKLDAYEALRTIVDGGIITRLDRAVLSELRAIRIERVTPEAPTGLHDDMAVSMALAYRALRDVPRTAMSRPRPVPTPRQQRRLDRIRKGGPWATRK